MKFLLSYSNQNIKIMKISTFISLKSLSIAIGLIFLFGGCNSTKTESSAELKIEYEKYTLENGLEVVLHHDKSDPIVAVAILYHVGSGREVPGKTGFAHLFEHILFQESENVPQDQFFKKIQDVGGTLNGGTSYDQTIYYEVVPKNALEKVLWMESDRMGFVINTLTQSAFVNQQNVVLNEKRQRVDNRPYGHTSALINKTIFPQGHPYNWTVIGEMEDIKNANLEDVKSFYDKFYGPNNATLVIAGDFNTEETKAFVDKYFAEIKKRQEVIKSEPMNVKLDSTVKLYHEDNFAKVPELNMVWPTVNEFSEDYYPLSFLSELLSEGKKSPMYKVMIKENQLTSKTIAYNSSRELAGTFNIVLKANQGHSLKELEEGVFESFRRFETDGITEIDMERIKAGLETQFYGGMSSILYKSFNLAYYNVKMDDPAYAKKHIEKIRAVTIDDVKRVYDKFIKNKPYLSTSFVPKGQVELIAEGSLKADIEEESIEEATEVADNSGNEEAEIVKTPSAIDRSIEPVLGAEPKTNLPSVWTSKLKNGLKIYGIEHWELPLVQFSLVIDGGLAADDINKVGVANLLTDIMIEGTANKTPEELEEEIKLLGATIKMTTGNEDITIYGSTLARNFDKTIALVKEILLQPRWDEEQFKLKKTKTINELKQRMASPDFIARVEFQKLVFGEDNIFGHYSYGKPEVVENITIDDLKNYYTTYLAPNVAAIHIAGAVNKEQVENAFIDLEEKWSKKEVVLPEYKSPTAPEKSALYFYNVPGAKQSVITVGTLGIPRTNPEFYLATTMNYKLGGSFSGILNLILREEKGFTYGAYSYFSGMKSTGIYRAYSSVRSNATLESVQIFKEEMEKYREGIAEEDLKFTKNALIRSNARRFETLHALVSMLETISSFDLPANYISQEEESLRNLSLEQHQALAQKYIDPSKMVYLIVGDAETQLAELKELGLGDAVLLN
jgi:zinc protease